MSALVGRKVYIRKGSGSPQVLVAAARTKSLTMNGAPIDISSDDDSGYRTLIETDAATRSLDMSIEGVTKNADFLNQLASGNFVDDYEIEIQGVAIINGSFFLTSCAINAPYNEATTFTAELQSTGSFTVTNTDSP